jgi:hypothetical protein
MVVLAATLYVCPGDVYVNEPKPGCKPFHESSKEGFSTVPESKEGATQGGPHGSSPGQIPGQSSEVIIVPNRGVVEQSGRAYASPETCELYQEWVKLYTKMDKDGLNANEYTVDEFERWEKIRYLFTSLNPPNCP